jgi:hypothetical protein
MEELFIIITTRNGRFAECPKHSAKPQKHSAKKAWQTVYRQSLICRVLFLGHSAKREHSTKKSGRYGDEVTETASLPSVKDGTRQRRKLC